MAREPSRGAVLDAAAIRRRLVGDRALIRELRDRERQIQPNGVDLTLASLWTLDGPGRVGTADAERVLSPRSELGCGSDGWFDLSPGPYMARMNEVVDLTADLMAFGKPRSSLLRCGVAIHNAVWDAGYVGRSEALLVVYNPGGFRVQRDARVLQLVFCRLENPTEPYRGRFQHENVAGELPGPPRPT